MGYFESAHLVQLAEADTLELTSSDMYQVLHERFTSLHQALLAQIDTNNIDLHPLKPNHPVTQNSVCTVELQNTICTQYTRTRGEALVVERLMGREEVATIHNVEARRHPVIELRLLPDYLVLELVLSPDAWWDQENLVGKLTVSRHKQTYHGLLRQYRAAYRMGFWRGTHLSNMHLTAAQFQHPRIMQEWMSTFEPSKDWFRLGIWYAHDDERLEPDSIGAELLREIQHLYALYEHFAWTSDNNYREFYEK